MPNPTKLSDLPDRWIVAWDTETSALHPDDGSRISVVSWAYRDPKDGALVYKAVPFDQGVDPAEVHADAESRPLPLGPKKLENKHIKRIGKWITEHGSEIYTAPNLPVSEYGRLMRQLSRFSLVAHNAKFDNMHALWGLRGCEGLPVEQGGGINLATNTISDTQINQHLIDSRESSALKSTSVRLGLGQELGLDAGTEDAEQRALKPWLGPKTDSRFDLVPWEVMRPYAALDPALTYLLFEYQEDLVEDPAFEHLRRYFVEELDLMKTLVDMERRGIGYDVQGSRAEAKKIAKMMDTVAANLPFKPTYPAAKKYFFGPVEEGGLGHLPYSDKMTATGQPSVNEEVVTRLAKEGVPNAAEFAEWAGLQSANSKWYTAWADLTGSDGRLRTVYKQTGVVSGRLAVGRAQLQAIPHNYLIPKGLVPVREMFHAKPGHQLWEMDVSQAEIRIATAVARCQQMLDQFLSGVDSHSAACWLMFQSEFKRDGFETLESAEAGHPKWGEYRQVAKRCNLGILYGAGVGTVRGEIKKFTGIDYPQRQVATWVDDWRRAFPPFVRLLELSARKAAREGWVRLINGKVRWFSDYEPTHKAANQVIQGSQAEVIKRLMVKVNRKYPGMLLLCVHDSVVLEIPDAQVDEVVQGVIKMMVKEFEDTFAKQWEPGGPVIVVPFAADAKRWDKAA